MIMNVKQTQKLSVIIKKMDTRPQVMSGDEMGRGNNLHLCDNNVDTNRKKIFKIYRRSSPNQVGHSGVTGAELLGRPKSVKSAFTEKIIDIVTTGTMFRGFKFQTQNDKA